MKGYEKGFQAISKYLHEAVEDKYLDDTFMFGESLIGGYDYTSRCRYVEAICEFWETLDDGQKSDLLHDVLEESPAVDFLSSPWREITGYLLSNPYWCHNVTETYHEYAKQCSEGKADDRKADEAMDKVHYL